jgi:competence ComEA-like helix-hairpin-helix protein
MRILGLCLILAGLSAAAPQKDTGRALLERTCTKCHELSGTLEQRNSKEQWSSIVDDMVAKGAEASDPEIVSIIDYLTRNYGSKILVNQATASELAANLEIPAGSAAAIVAYREKNGAFKGADDLKKVPGLDWAALGDKKDRFDFSVK